VAEITDRPGPTRAVIAPNAFKGTLSAAQASRAITAGVRQAWPRAECREVPLADGGDGFLETLLASRGGRVILCQVSGPLLEPVSSQLGWLDSLDDATAVLELAGACGLSRLAHPDPFTAGRASTRGLGDLLLAALDQEPRRVLIGLGGSASTDGGAGLAQALGFLLLDRHGDQVPPGGLGLLELDRIESPATYHRPDDVELLAACDVNTPLLGPQGAAAVFAPQKGANPETVEQLERGLERLARVVARDLGVTGLGSGPGMGAAGGTGFGLASFCGAHLASGVELVASVVGLDLALDQADLVFTGEGRFDQASLQGKVVGEVLQRSAARDLPCVVLAGSADPSAAAQARRQGALVVSTRPPGADSGNLTAERASSDLSSAAARACLELSESGLGGPSRWRLAGGG
jgi:glycerate kinase